MEVVCGGWRGIDGRRVHEDYRVLVAEDGRGGPWSNGICHECKAAFLELLAQLHEEQKEKP